MLSFIKDEQRVSGEITFIGKIKENIEQVDTFVKTNWLISPQIR